MQRATVGEAGDKAQRGLALDLKAVNKVRKKNTRDVIMIYCSIL